MSFDPVALIPVLVISVVFTLGLSLQWQHFAQLASAPKPLLVGIAGQILLLPTVAVLVVSLIPMPPLLAAGLVLLACCPGGPISNAFAHLAKADVALSMALTSISSLISVASLPLIMAAYLQWNPVVGEVAIRIPVLDTVAQLFLLTLMPLGAGMCLRHWRADFAEHLRQRVQPISLLLMFSLIFVLWYQDRAMILEAAAQSFWPAVLFTGGNLLAAFCLGRLVRLGRAQRATLVLELGVQNATLAFYVAVNILDQPNMTLPSLIYSLLIMAAAFIIVVQQRSLAAKE